MIDPNYPTRKAVYSLLTGITYNSVAVPVYYLEAPTTNTAANYIVINGISGNDLRNMNKNATSNLFSVTIYTHQLNTNAGLAKDVIASEVLTRIYPTPSATLDLSADNLQNTLIELSGDREDDYMIRGAEKYIDRTLTFRFHIHQK